MYTAVSSLFPQLIIVSVAIFAFTTVQRRKTFVPKIQKINQETLPNDKQWLPSAEKNIHMLRLNAYTLSLPTSFRIKQYLIIQRCSADQRHTMKLAFISALTTHYYKEHPLEAIFSIIHKTKVMKKSSETQG